DELKRRPKLLRALVVGASLPPLALAATAVYLSSLKEIDDGLEGLMIVPILFVLGIAAPFMVTASLETLACILAGAVVSGGTASICLGIGPAAGVGFVIFCLVPGVLIGSGVH